MICFLLCITVLFADSAMNLYDDKGSLYIGDLYQREHEIGSYYIDEGCTTKVHVVYSPSDQIEDNGKSFDSFCEPIDMKLQTFH